jgi:hypothetical protein
VERNHVDVAGMPADADTTISHFIPSVELTGSRREKLRKLDTLIRHLEQLRRGLAFDIDTEPARVREGVRPAWAWFTAGLAVGALGILLLLKALGAL